MSPVDYRAVTDVDFRAFTAAFNLAYSDYFTPISMTVSSFRSLIERDDLSLQDSVAAVEDKRIVGTGLLGIRDNHGWIGGMGVVPDHRRRGIGRHMMLFLIERARQHGLSHIDLEVIDQNYGAHALYLSLGFIETRSLVSVEREPGIPANLEAIGDYNVQEQAVTTLLPHYNDFHTVENCWQRSLRSLELLVPHIEGWSVTLGDCLAGYGLGWAGRHGVRLIDFAMNPNGDPQAAGTAMLTALHSRYPDAPGSTYNTPADDPVLQAYWHLDYQTSLKQIEMRLPLA
ncbi:MAG TPA: GNAT family N-acetyltransferase [Aggregatilinea sp.]|jgi:ribosomal protein S18 acetylase RimI-like enzyme|uniref:GNAT family N-acetyltransferase n=1 Tax=Aggregatilinea sp. TaxID=2806333 RepID=UPI002BA3BE8B|nr:GNAT family N-acetyltransferase [Aggregatilinea sp.]HML20024.1 GNAT family N-acetyltransferase [Aggregatilinea sp.]